MKYPANIKEVLSLKPDYLGFIFYKQSKRYIADLSPEFLSTLQAVNKVGVFVNDSVDRIRAVRYDYNLQAIQLHGDEDPVFVSELKDLDVPVIKAFGISQDFNWAQLNDYESLVDFFLFDTKSQAYGGTGQRFDWSLLERYVLEKPFFLSGGLDQENIATAMRMNDPRLHALDVNSKFEKSPGLKDVSLLRSAFPDSFS
ncbi:phosphoribosylanthranilate isomerase [Olivibacter sp. CPCC 100613]|uniref:phosphoribosylanthranilate isomerase n=1 Tax=Olivibacter sp. CPCC 100613 TaxID=3079931 RepID=UPI002FF58DED